MRKGGGEIREEKRAMYGFPGYFSSRVYQQEKDTKVESLGGNGRWV